MPSSVLSFLANAAVLVTAAELNFKSNSKFAKIITNCEASGPYVSTMYPTDFDQAHGGTVNVYFGDVATDCIDYKSDVPCANHTADYTPQFWCEFVGSEGAYMTGPFHASVLRSSGKPEAFIQCATPPHDTVAAMVEYGGAGTEEVLELHIKYGADNTSLSEIPYRGAPGKCIEACKTCERPMRAECGNTVTFTGLFEPPSPLTPPAPPTAPPPDCVYMHNTLTWSYQYSTTSGCAYRDLNRWRWRTYSSRTWSQCMDLSSNYGVMTAAHTYTTYGWTGHRYETQASTWQGSWSAISLYAITNSWNCILGREYRNIDIFDEPLGGTTQTNLDFEDYLWLYTDYGPLFYDECRNLAGRAGANMITPFTVGKTEQTGNYWRMSGYNCNAFNWITSTGTTMGYSKPSNYARGVTQNCMIGYRLCEPPE